MAGVNVRVFLAEFLENPLPETVSESHGIRFVTHAQALQAVLAGVFESVADDALDPFAGIHVFLNSDLVRGPFLEESANTGVQAFGVFADDHQADVFFRAVAKRGKTVVEQLDGPGIDVEVQLEAQAQQNVGGMLVRGNARIAKRTKENGVKFIAQHFDSAGRQRDAFAQILVGAPIKFDEFERPIGGGCDGLQDFDGLWGHFGADAVPGNDRDARFRTATSHGNARQALPSSTAAIRAA